MCLSHTGKSKIDTGKLAGLPKAKWKCDQKSSIT